MNNLPIMRAAFLLTFPLATLSARDLVPEHWIENVPATNDSIQTSLVFRTVPGVAYQVETSEGELNNWVAGDEIYGMGHEYVVPMREYTPPPPPEPGSTPITLPPPSINVSVILQPSSDPAGGTVVSWRSLDDGGPMKMLLEDNLHPDWNMVPLYSRRFDDHYFFVWHPTLAVAPPAAAPSLGVKDAAMIAILDESLPTMNQEVADQAEHIRNLPPPAPVVPGPKKFWRIKADWSVDTDGDGSLDWEEFEITADPLHPSYALGDAFNADADGNGVADGDQADTDSDGIANSKDADRGNNVVDWQRANDVRFAWFEVAPPESPWGGEQAPKQVTDRGHVVFSWGLWSSGVYGNVSLSGNRTDNCTIVGMNGTTLLGVGNYDNNNDGHAELGCMVWWQNDHNGQPGPVTVNGSFAQFPFSSHPSNGQFLGNDLGFVANVYTQGTIAPQISRWKLPEPGTSGSVSFGAVDQWVMSGVNDSVLWGGNQANIGGVTTTLPGTYQRMVVTPGNSVLAFSESGFNPALYRNGSWTVEKTFEKLVDFSNKGFGVSASPVTLWNNSKVEALTIAAPGLPQEWQDKSRFIDLSDAGNLLVSRQDSPSEDPDAYGFGIPISVEDNAFGTGVDVTSITSTAPGPGIDNKLWIMAPAGGTNEVKFKSTADAGYCQLDITSTPATFTPATLTSANQIVSVGATAGSNTADSNLNIYNGSAQSLSSPVGIKVMKKRTVRVKVWIVPRKYGEGETSYYDPVYTPEDDEEEEELSEYLTEVFSTQINASIECSVERAPAVDYDKTDGTVFGGPSGSTWINGVGILNAHNLITGELDAVSDTTDPNYHINLYLVGGANHGTDVDYLDLLNRFSESENWVGTHDRDGKRCWVIGGYATESTTLTPAKIRDTMAHEIGHILVGEGHPNDEQGVAPLPGSDRISRLMCKGSQRRKDGSSRLLVKGEWDEAEEWLHRVVDTPQP